MAFSEHPAPPAPAATRACFVCPSLLHVEVLGVGPLSQSRCKGVEMSDAQGRSAGSGTRDLTISNLVKLDMLNVPGRAVSGS